MASKVTASNSTTTTAASAALFLFLNLLFFAMKTGACGSSCPTPITPKPPSGSGGGKCPVDTLKLVVCANVLDGLITVGLGKFPKQPCECCTLIAGLVDLEAAVCLCTVVRANVHGISLNVPIKVSLLLNYCGKKIPEDFQCPY